MQDSVHVERLDDPHVVPRLLRLLGGPLVLGSVAQDMVFPADRRYSAVTSPPRAETAAESAHVLQQISTDETLGGSAQDALARWTRTWHN
jgi:hypothetical protein